MATTPDGVTRAEGVHARLRADILAGLLEPGQRLKFPELCRRYGTSVGAAREALTKLAAAGLVKSQAHQGYFVTPLSVEELEELTRARVEIESLVLRLAIQDGDVQWEAQAIAAHHVLERASRADPLGEFVAAHAAFHASLVAGCRNRRLREVATSLRDEAELYRQWSIPAGQRAGRDVAAEHRAILEAAIARDADLAADLLRAHITRTTDLLLGSDGLRGA
jgi:DNA-binding GntR family transcriptional regulator